MKLGYIMLFIVVIDGFMVVIDGFMVVVVGRGNFNVKYKGNKNIDP